MSKPGARDWYEDGVAEHYREHGADYRNPHALIIDRCMEIAASKWSLKLENVLDLAAGAGEFTLALSRAVRLPLAPSPNPSREGRGVDHSHRHSKSPESALHFSACDAFTMRAYLDQTGLPCEQFTFEQIAGGALRGRGYSLIGCSFAMHLCPPSQLPMLLIELSQVSLQLMILSPHKRPIIREGWGWTLTDSFSEQRVHVRLLESTIEQLESTIEKATLGNDS